MPIKVCQGWRGFSGFEVDNDQPAFAINFIQQKMKKLRPLAGS